MSEEESVGENGAGEHGEWIAFTDWTGVPSELREIVFTVLRTKVAECDVRIAEWTVTRSPLTQTSTAIIAEALDEDDPDREMFLANASEALNKCANSEMFARMLERRGLLSAIAALGGEMHPDALPWDRVASEVRFLASIHLNDESLKQQRDNVRATLHTLIAQEAIAEISALAADMGNVTFGSAFGASAYTVSSVALDRQFVVTALLTAAADYLDALSEGVDEKEGDDDEQA